VQHTDYLRREVVSVQNPIQLHHVASRFGGSCTKKMLTKIKIFVNNKSSAYAELLCLCNQFKSV
jgi:hypothetical protein